MQQVLWLGTHRGKTVIPGKLAGCGKFGVYYSKHKGGPGISERGGGGGGGGLYTIVVTFSANGVEGELRPRESGTSS